MNLTQVRAIQLALQHYATYCNYFLPQCRQNLKGPLELARTKVDADVDDQHSEVILKT